MKLKDVLNQTDNSRNKQISLTIKKRELKKLGLTTKDILDIPIPKKGVKL